MVNLIILYIWMVRIMNEMKNNKFEIVYAGRLIDEIVTNRSLSLDEALKLADIDINQEDDDVNPVWDREKFEIGFGITSTRYHLISRLDNINIGMLDDDELERLKISDLETLVAELEDADINVELDDDLIRLANIVKKHLQSFAFQVGCQTG